MASISKRYNKLVVDFRYMGKRCRETTNLVDTPANRKKLTKIIEKMEAEITLGLFDYTAYFPKSEKGRDLMILNDRSNSIRSDIPLFGDFVPIWFEEKQIEWRESYKGKLQDIIEKYLIPYFGTRCIAAIVRTDVLAFRSSLAKVTYGKTNKHLSADRINSIMTTLHMILQEASRRYNFDNPYEDIKVLKIDRKDIQPFTLNEVWQFIRQVRADYRNYYIVRFFSGMRTSEIDGLTWEHVDFERREIRIRQTLVKGVIGRPKTDGSNREIMMSSLVYDALLEQKKVSFGRSKFVFCTRNGGPLNYHNINKKIWHPTLKVLGLKPRSAYQTRHTAATLWLAAGEAPEWIAKQMGHANTTMLFKVYSRYVPNMTRRDGSAFENLIIANDIHTLAPSKYQGDNHE